MLWVSPTEHDLHRLLPAINTEWKISSLPEQHGCDILVPTPSGIVGFQRKTLPDLVASLKDGRLNHGLNQLSSSATVRFGYLLVESEFQKTVDGNSYTEAPLSVATLRSIVAKFSVFNISYVPTQSPRDTVRGVLSISDYLASGRAEVIHRPKQTTNEWGQTTNEAYAVFLLQSFPGIGPKVARSIYRHFGHVPIAWTITPAELAAVPGIGRKRAESLLAALAPRSPSKAAAGP